MRGKFYYCYNNKIKEYLMEKGYEYVLVSVNPNSKRTFWLFERDDKLTNYIDKYYTV